MSRCAGVVARARVRRDETRRCGGEFLSTGLPKRLFFLIVGDLGHCCSFCVLCCTDFDDVICCTDFDDTTIHESPEPA
jgi:hypothetical protein